MFTTYIWRALRATAACALLFLGFHANLFAAGYTTSGGRIFDASGNEIQIKGVSHYGFNSTILQPQFLWAMGWKEQLAQIKSLGFNAVRVPFVPDTLYNSTAVDRLSYIDPGRNPELLGKTPLAALDIWLAEANRLGLYILLDFHSVSMQRQYPTWFVSNSADFGLMYNRAAYTPSDWRRDLEFVARRYAALEYFLGIDIYNEPNGQIRWSNGDPSMRDPNYYWKTAAESAAATILAANPRLLIFVQGITGNYDGIEDSNVPLNWAENFRPQAYQPLNIPTGKLVLSPHTYGPDVYPKASFSAPNYPANLAADWESLFGQFSNVYAVVPGEWGGRYGNGVGGAQDKVWQDAFVNYMLSKGMRNSFYWCYTPNSNDTGGILDDNLNVRADKMALLQRLWGGTTSTPPPPPPTPTPTPTPPPPTTTPPPPSPSSTIAITNFSPLSGPIGTVVTINGSGFTGMYQAGWIGASHSAAVQVVSDTQLKVTIPSGATSGAIGLFKSNQTAFTAQWFTVIAGSTPPPTTTPPPPTTTPPPPATATTPVQPMISNFSPASGAPGTVVTVNGSGFTGLTEAWIGNAHGVPVRVLSDRQVQVTIPAGATNGAIGLFNARYTAFTATWFTVTSAATYPQPDITSFSPASGPVGTVVTITGSGMTGLNQAWVGSVKNAVVRVISDSQATVTIPAGAVTSQIGILNPKHAAFTGSAFVVR